MQPHRWQPSRLHHPWDSPGKNTGVGCHFLLQCVKVKSESEVIQSCPILRDPMNCSLPGSSVHGIFQARVLEWVAIAFSIDSIKYLRNPSQIHKYCSGFSCLITTTDWPMLCPCVFNVSLASLGILIYPLGPHTWLISSGFGSALGHSHPGLLWADITSDLGVAPEYSSRN